MGLFKRAAAPSFSSKEEAVEFYRRLVVDTLKKAGPESREWKTVLKSVDDSSDKAYLWQLRAGAQKTWDSHGRRTSLFEQGPEKIEHWIDDLVRRINARLRIVAPRPPKPPAIVGDMHHQEEMRRVFEHRRAKGSTTSAGQLVPEPENQYDSNAVAVVVAGERVGYLKREVAASYSPAIQQLGRPIECTVSIYRDQSTGGLLASFAEPLPGLTELGAQE
jgi:hypothetical protein